MALRDLTETARSTILAVLDTGGNLNAACRAAGVRRRDVYTAMKLGARHPESRSTWADFLNALKGRQLDYRPRSFIASEQEQRAIAAAPSPCLYVLAAGEGRRRVKVGTARGPKGLLSRVITLRASSPLYLDLVAILPGGHAEEKAFHDRFARARLHGEWFNGDDPALRKWMGEIDHAAQA